MDEDIIKCCIAASLDCVEVVRDDDNLDSRGLLVRSPDGRASTSPAGSPTTPGDSPV